MTEVLAIDYDTARPMPQAIKAAGYIAVIRYLDGGAVPGKSLSVPEATALHSAGLGIGLIWETTGDRALSGASGGAADGKAAVAQAHALGVPAGAPLLCNLGDVPATAAQIPAIHSYYYEFRRASGFTWEPGGYATEFIISQLVAAGAAGLWWQNAENDAGVPGGPVGPHTNIYQRTTPTHIIIGTPSSAFDEDLIVTPADVHWWMPATTTWVDEAVTQCESLLALLKAHQ